MSAPAAHAAMTCFAVATAGDHRVDKDGKRFDCAGVFAMRQNDGAGDKLHVGGGDYRNHHNAAGAMKQRLHPERCVVSDSLDRHLVYITSVWCLSMQLKALVSERGTEMPVSRTGH